MTFLNLTLLFGALAALIPLVIYLFNRRRFQKVNWGAMRFLKGENRENRRRIKLKRWLLILVRMVIPAFLALGMALPVLTGASELTGTSKTSMVILLDNSYSMNAGPAAESYFSKARNTAREILRNLPDGSEASILLIGGEVRSLPERPTSDLPGLIQKLDELEAGYGRADVAAGLDKALNILKKMHYLHKEVVVISDFQRVSWKPEETSVRKPRVDKIRNLNGHPFVNCIPVGNSSNQENVAITSLDTSRLATGVEQNVHIRATVENFGTETVTGLRLYFQVNREGRSASEVSLEPGEQKQVLFKHAFEQPGSHTVSVHTEADRLEEDNRKTTSIKVWETIPVTLVDGDPNPEPLRGETDFLRIALGPFGLEKRGESKDLMDVRVVKTNELDEEVFSQTSVLVLANVSSLEDQQVSKLESFLRKGNGLLVFPGDRADLEWYNSVLFSRNRILPLRMIKRSESGEDPISLMATNYNHPALELFNDPDKGQLSTIRVTSWYRLGGLQPSEGQDSDVLARLNNGDPFLAERSFKEGRVIQSSIPADADWSNMPVKPVYVPLMQQLVTYLASKVYPPRNVNVGESIMAILPPSMAGKDARLTGPGDLDLQLTAKKKRHESIVRYDQTTRPGIYTLNLPEPKKTEVQYVVSTDREESDLKRLTDAQISSTVNAMNATLVSAPSDYLERTAERRVGQELWQMIALALLGLLFIEILLQQSLGGK